MNQALSRNFEPNALASGVGEKNCQKQGPRLAPSAHKRMNFQLRDRAWPRRFREMFCLKALCLSVSVVKGIKV